MSNTLDILDCKGARVGEYVIPEGVIELEKGEQAVHDAVVAYLAGLRAGTACTKTRGEVSGGGAKPFRQKGTAAPVPVRAGARSGSVAARFSGRVRVRSPRRSIRRFCSSR